MQRYRELKRLAAGDLRADTVAACIGEMASRSRKLLKSCKRVELKSKVADKLYFGYSGTVESRPINRLLYIENERQFQERMEAFLAGKLGADTQEVARVTYTIACCIFAAHDVNQVGRKASATFFEILIGHIVARILGVSPRRKVRIPESQADLPADYVFDPGRDSRKIHLPIKTSTRERAVQAWVHQLVLDRIFGNGVYRGILVVSGETKRDSRTGEVIEICVPKQLQMFQARVAEISRVYYLDLPQTYLALNESFPRLEVKSFGHAVTELPGLLQA